MKHTRYTFLLLLLSMLMVLAGCAKKDASSELPDDDPLTNGTVIAQGIFSGNSNYRVSGSARILDVAGAKVLRLENFSSSNGPDLKVYLASDISATRFINLGNLKSVSGNQNYDISGMPDLARFPYALIWCEQFGALFGSANLK